MTVQDVARTVTVPLQGGPADQPLSPPPPAPAAPAPAPAALLGRDRPLTGDERQFAVALVAMLAGLTVIIVTGLLLAEYALT